MAEQPEVPQPLPISVLTNTRGTSHIPNGEQITLKRPVTKMKSIYFVVTKQLTCTTSSIALHCASQEPATNETAKRK